MYTTGLTILFGLSLGSTVYGAITTNYVDFFDNCGKQYTVYDISYYTVDMDKQSRVWTTTCSVTFRASSTYDNLYYKFTQASIPIGVVIQIYSSSSTSYRLKSTYTWLNSPSINSRNLEDRYIKISVPFSLSAGSLSAKIDLYTDEYDNWPFGLAGWAIACIATGCVVFVIIVVVSIGCLCKKSAGHRGRVVGPVGQVQVVTTTTAAGNHTNPQHMAMPPPPAYQNLYSNQQYYSAPVGTPNQFPPPPASQISHTSATYK